MLIGWQMDPFWKFGSLVPYNKKASTKNIRFGLQLGEGGGAQSQGIKEQVDFGHFGN